MCKGNSFPHIIHRKILALARSVHIPAYIYRISSIHNGNLQCLKSPAGSKAPVSFFYIHSFLLSNLLFYIVSSKSAVIKNADFPHRAVSSRNRGLVLRKMIIGVTGSILSRFHHIRIKLAFCNSLQYHLQWKYQRLNSSI